MRTWIRTPCQTCSRSFDSATTEERLETFDQSRGKAGFREPRNPSDTRRATCRGRLERHDVERGLLVWMRPAQGLHDGSQLPSVKRHLEAHLGDPLQPSGLPDRRCRALASEERALAPGRERALAVEPDAPCARRRQRVAHGVGSRLRHEYDELVRVRAGNRGRLQGAPIDDGRARRTRHAIDKPVVHTALDRVERGVRRVHRDSRAHRVDRDAALPRGAVEALERLEEQRVVADDQSGADRPRLFQHLGQHVDREQRPRDRPVVARHEKPDLVPWLGKRKRRNVPEGCRDVGERSRHGAVPFDGVRSRCAASRARGCGRRQAQTSMAAPNTPASSLSELATMSVLRRTEGNTARSKPFVTRAT